MNPLTPPLHVSAAYVALWAGREPAARLMTALRDPGQHLAMTRLWSALLAENRAASDAARARLAQAVFVLSDSLNARPHEAPRVVGTVVKTLRPPPDPPPGYLWARSGPGEPWALRPVSTIPDADHTEASPRLGAVCVTDDRLAVVGADETFTAYEEAATVSEQVMVTARSGLDAGLRAARHVVKRGLPGADAALSLAERLSAAVEGL